MALPVRYTESMSPGVDLGFTLALQEPLAGSDFEDLKRLIDSWYEIGFYGGFGGTGFHDIMNLDYDEDDLMVSWTVDMGDVVSTEAVDVLARALEGFSQPTDDGPLIKLKELVVGHIVE